MQERVRHSVQHISYLVPGDVLSVPSSSSAARDCTLTNLYGLEPLFIIVFFSVTIKSLLCARVYTIYMGSVRVCRWIRNQPCWCNIPGCWKLSLGLQYQAFGVTPQRCSVARNHTGDNLKYRDNQQCSRAHVGGLQHSVLGGLLH